MTNPVNPNSQTNPNNNEQPQKEETFLERIAEGIWKTYCDCNEHCTEKLVTKGIPQGKEFEKEKEACYKACTTFQNKCPLNW